MTDKSSQFRSTLTLENVEEIGKYFDVEFYQTQKGTPSHGSKDELVDHYIRNGMELNLDPVAWFSTERYLQKNTDVAAQGMNPFLHFIEHGVSEGRPPLPDLEGYSIEEIEKIDPKKISAIRTKLLRATDPEEKSEFKIFLEQCLEDSTQNCDNDTPVVSVLVPNYNHKSFLSERIESILNQSFRSIEIIILDDFSTDGSQELIETYKSKYPDKIKYIANEDNSGNVFKQWKKGIDLCQGKYIWICESDDTAETDFLDKMVPEFDDLAVMIAFCKVQFMDEKGNEIPGLDAYRERAEPGAWTTKRSGPAAAWFAGAFSVHNIIPNVGGCLIRRQTIENEIWESAQQYDVLGDWFLYLNLARGGKLAYVPNTTTYFRQHGRNTSVKSFQGTKYYCEHNNVAIEFKNTWDITPDTTWRFYKQLETQYTSINERNDDSLFEHFSLDKILRTKRSKQHVLIGFMGFHVGGGEYFPIYIANALAKTGTNVSLLALDTDQKNKDMYDLVDNRVPIYSAKDVRNLGPSEFLKQTGATLINSHHIGIEGLFFLEHQQELDIPFISTLHGTYEVAGVDQYNLTKIIRNVDHWIYTADKNIRHLKNRPWCETGSSKLPNATPIDNRPFHLSRKLLNINKNTFVFALVSRPVKEKGWEEAINSFIKLKSSDHDVALLLIGEGTYQQDLEDEYGHVDGLYFLGYQSNMHGLFNMCNCCLLPTRFPGESYPLILIQALQSSIPCVSTDIGEISNILMHDGKTAGYIIEHDDDLNFQSNLENAMESILVDINYEPAKVTATEIGKLFNVDSLAKEYLKVFQKVIHESIRQEDLAAGDQSKPNSIEV